MEIHLYKIYVLLMVVWRKSGWAHCREKRKKVLVQWEARGYTAALSARWEKDSESERARQRAEYPRKSRGSFTPILSALYLFFLSPSLFLHHFSLLSSFFFFRVLRHRCTRCQLVHSQHLRVPSVPRCKYAPRSFALGLLFSASCCYFISSIRVWL